MSPRPHDLQELDQLTAQAAELLATMEAHLEAANSTLTPQQQ